MEDVIISDSGGEALGVNISDCEDVELLSLILGDINFDGQINFYDIGIIINYLFANIILSDLQISNADLDYNQTINIFDVLLIIDISNI